MDSRHLHWTWCWVLTLQRSVHDKLHVLQYEQHPQKPVAMPEQQLRMTSDITSNGIGLLLTCVTCRAESLATLLEQGFGFESYVNFALNMPMTIVRRCAFGAESCD